MTNTGVFSEIRVKHQKNWEAMLAALPEEDREAARQRLTAEVIPIVIALRADRCATLQ